MHTVLISTYDLGRQPFGLASPAAWLREAGVDVTCVDLTREAFDPAVVASADVIGFFLPMHTATRLALPLIDRVRALNPSARLCAYGLYAPLNEALLRARGVAHVLGPEFEEDLTAVVVGTADGRTPAAAVPGVPVPLPRLKFRVPDRGGLPPLDRYASLTIGGSQRVVGYTEASRGCKHHCRHCPIVPVYGGRFRVVPVDVVMADVGAQVAAGAQHVTFGDPDFLNGPRHARAIVEAFACQHPDVTYDVTIKVEHLLAHADLLPVLRDTGCVLVTTAVESLEDAVLEKLKKGHTRADVERVVARCREIGLALAPTFVVFTPWTSLDGYCALLADIDRLDLVGAVAPVQYAIRLLVPEGSLMLDLPDMRARVSEFDAASLTHRWSHADPRVDALQRDVEALVAGCLDAPREEVFARVWQAAHAAAGRQAPARVSRESSARVPRLSEAWYCCAEPVEGGES